jgi:hypothetical protein
MFVILNAPFLTASDKKETGGWEEGSPYNKLYDPKEIDSFKGYVKSISEKIPMPGMTPAVVLLIKEGEDIHVVHVCPAWYRNGKDVGIRKGDKVKVKGCWTEIGNEDIFLASKIKKGDYFEFKVRLTKNGKPFWTMSKQELAKELGETK